MDKWLSAALEYVPQWLDFQMEQAEAPGCSLAIARDGKVIFEKVFGSADLRAKTPLTPRHRFRVASHSKSFTAAGVMLLRERKKLTLDDEAGRYVSGLHKSIAGATIAQLLSHGAGILRDGPDTGQWTHRRPFLNEKELRADLTLPPTLPASERFKYSNHGYGLLGLIIEAVAGESWRDFIAREVVKAAGLKDTYPDAPVPRGVPLATGHSTKMLLGERFTIPTDQSTHAMAAATGFVSTARDLALFFNQLAPQAKRSILSAASRREMTRRLWRNPHASLEGYYGLGIISGSTGGWDWFGHSGGFPGTITRTTTIPSRGITVSVLTNSADGYAAGWGDGVIQILRRFEKDGAPRAALKKWSGRWWSLWGALDLVPVGEKVLVATPGFFNPFLDAGEITVGARNRGALTLAHGYGSHGEPAELVTGRGGKAKEVVLAGSRLLSRAAAEREARAKFRAGRTRGATARRA
ncbi:MAG: serine hydrolase [Rhizobiales bacterium 65-9]|nr:beta-lactamase family protein [Hyphomicrobiales bacterium]OJY35409.1 MAG: serine hydrolase [Rhizobiales bacterium 65-9]